MYPVTPRSSDRQNGTTYRMPVLKRSAGTVEKVLWRYDLPPGLTTELKRKADLRETSTITINLLELLGMVVTAWVMLEFTGDRPASIDPTAMRGGARDQRACLLMRMLGGATLPSTYPVWKTPRWMVNHAGPEQSWRERLGN